jgi:hypothetical protein
MQISSCYERIFKRKLGSIHQMKMWHVERNPYRAGDRASAQPPLRQRPPRDDLLSASISSSSNDPVLRCPTPAATPPVLLPPLDHLYSHRSSPPPPPPQQTRTLTSTPGSATPAPINSPPDKARVPRLPPHTTRPTPSLCHHHQLSSTDSTSCTRTRTPCGGRRR